MRSLLPIGCREGVARRLPALQPVSLRAANTRLPLLERREHLLPAGLLQVLNRRPNPPLHSPNLLVTFLLPPLFIRIFGGGQCARCFQPIPPSALVMRSGDLTFHPQCFSCQVCPNPQFCLFTAKYPPKNE